MDDFADSHIPSLEYDEGNWRVSVRKDVAGNADLVMLSNTASSRLTGEGNGETEGSAILVIRYRDNTAQVFVNWDIASISTNTPRVYHRFDGEGDLSSLEWLASTDGTATFYPGDDIQFIKQICNAETLLVAMSLNDEQNVVTLFDVAGLEQAIAPFRDAGGFWRISVSTDPFDDSVVTILSVDADDSVNEDYPSLMLRYSGDGHEVYIVWGVDIGYDSPVDVRYRIGRQPSECDEWVMSTSRRGTFYAGDVRQLIKRLAESDQFLASVTPYRSNPITARFDLRGLPAIVGLLG